MKEQYRLGGLFLPLILPLSVLSVVFFILGKFLRSLMNFQGLLYNLATTFLGILLTVVYINYVLYRKEKSYWNVARERIYKILSVFANIVITNFRLQFNFGPEIIKERKHSSEADFLYETRSEMIRIATDILIPSAEAKVNSLDVKGWENLDVRRKSIWDEAERILRLFGNYLEPEILSLLLDIQEKVRDIYVLYSTYPDICGFSDEDLEKKYQLGMKVSPIELKNYINKWTTDYIRDMLTYAVKILEYVGEK